ncbi:MAG: glycosyltransferase family protein [Flavobacteriaceae bacterium]|nr:glycosyltransferase family protein [Flavobacteriaceae bacterium]
MKVLYAIQGIGNGHLSRAIEVVPTLMNRVEVDILVSGIQSDIELPFPVKYRYEGLSFIFGKKGGIDYFLTLKRINLFRVLKEINNCPVENYDLIINDFEPISAWAAKLKGITCISLSHQSALLSPKVPKPKHKDWLSMIILKYYAPTTQKFGFHFKAYDFGIYLPIIRSSIRNAKRKQKEYYTIYLPAYSDERIIEVLSKIENVEWQLFSKHSKNAYTTKNFSVKPIETKSFEKSITRCRGVICGAGFETPAEALYLKKKLLVIPMKGQYEQHINAAGLADLGVLVIQKLDLKFLDIIKNWVESKEIIQVSYPDTTQEIIDNVLSRYIIASNLSNQLIYDL